MKRDEDDTNGRIKIEGKAKMKARGLKSPNLVEAFMVTLASPDAAVKSNHKPAKPRDKYREAREAPENFDRNWLVA
jgi:hypothetical protein